MTRAPSPGEPCLRVVLLCDDEPFEIPRTVGSIVESLPGWRFTVASMGGHASLRDIRLNSERYLGLYGPLGFMARGSWMILLKVLAALRAPTAAPHSLAQAASRSGADFITIDRVNSDAGRAALEALEPDVLVSIACPQILRPRTLAIPAVCALNLHSALLPMNRGMLPTFWSLFSEPPRAGVTLHLMTAELDGGEILLQREIPVSRRTTSLHSLIRRCKRTGAEMVTEGLLMVARGSWATRPNPSGEGSRNGFPTKADVAEFRRRGGRIW